MGIVRVLFLLAFLGPAGPILFAQPPDQPAPPSVSALIAELGSSKAKEREAAVGKLIARPDAWLELEQALRSPDAEVRRLARRVLDVQHRAAQPRLARRVALAAKAGEIDLFLDLLAGLEKGPGPTEWEAAATVARAVAAEAVKRNPKGPDYVYALPDAIDLSKPLPPPHPHEAKFFLGRERRWAKHKFAIELIGEAFLLCASSANAGGRLTKSVVFASGDTLSQGLVGSLIICDGDLVLKHPIYDSVVIARGSVRFDAGVFESVVLAGGAITDENRGKHCTLFRKSVVAEKQSKFLGAAHFFEPARLGVTAAAEKGIVRVATAEPGKPFAKAGVAAGDAVLAVDGTAVATADEFRRLLRKGYALRQQVTLRLRRGDAERELTVSLPD